MRVLDFEDHVAQELSHARFDAQRRNLRLLTAILILLFVLAIFLPLVTDVACWPGLLMGTLALTSGAGLAHFEGRFRANSALRGQLRAGLRGQNRTVDILSVLDDDYYLLNNLKMPERADDVDHLVVGPNGIFALETKNHRGHVYCRDGQWYQAKVSRSGRQQPEEPIRDPTQQLKRNVDYLRSCINNTDRELSRRTRLWIEGAAVFTHPSVRVELGPQTRDRLPFPAIHAQELPAHITQHMPRRPYSKGDVRRIVSMFAHLRAPGTRHTA
ncbi:MAG: NERD domain-containing protein [Anaerolineae bacterium]